MKSENYNGIENDPKIIAASYFQDEFRSLETRILNSQILEESERIMTIIAICCTSLREIYLANEIFKSKVKSEIENLIFGEN